MARSTRTAPARRSPRCARCRCWRGRTSRRGSSCRRSPAASTSWSTRPSTRRASPVREVVAVPGRVEQDVVETADVFVPAADGWCRADGYPPHPDRFERAGIDLSALLSRAPPERPLRTAFRGALPVWWCWVPVPRCGRPPRPGPLDPAGDELRQADMAGLSVRTLAAGVVVALLLVCARPRRRRVLPIAVCFAAIAPACRWRSSGGGPVAAGPSCATCGRRPSTTSPRASARGCRCPRRSPSWGPAVRPSCVRRSATFAEDYRATGRFLDSSTGSRNGSPTRWPTASSRRCASPARSAAATSDACCARCPLPARRRPHPRRARGAPVVDGQRCPLAVAARGSCSRCSRRPEAVTPTTPAACWCSGSAGRVGGRVPRDGAGRAAARGERVLR